MSEQDKAFAAIEVELGWLIDGRGCYKSDKLRAALDAYIDARIEAKNSHSSSICPECGGIFPAHSGRCSRYCFVVNKPHQEDDE